MHGGIKKFIFVLFHTLNLQLQPREKRRNNLSLYSNICGLFLFFLGGGGEGGVTCFYLTVDCTVHFHYNLYLFYSFLEIQNKTNSFGIINSYRRKQNFK